MQNGVENAWIAGDVPDLTDFFKPLEPLEPPTSQSSITGRIKAKAKNLLGIGIRDELQIKSYQCKEFSRTVKVKDGKTYEVISNEYHRAKQATYFAGYNAGTSERISAGPPYEYNFDENHLD